MPQEDFFTQDTANAGIRLPLSKPNGEATEEWLLIRGIDSDAFRSAEVTLPLKFQREVASKPTLTDSEKAELNIKLKRELLASLIADSSFEIPDKILFLTKAPQILDAIDVIATSRKRFFTAASVNSSNTPKQS